MTLFCADLILGTSIFQTVQYKFSLGELYDLNTIIMKKNCTWRNLKHSGDAMLQNSTKFLNLKFAGSALKISETKVRAVKAQTWQINKKIIGLGKNWGKIMNFYTKVHFFQLLL